MSQGSNLSQRIQPHEATPWVIEAIRAVETSLELSRGEVHRLTRELAEARETLQLVERWANHHGVKPRVTPAEALGVIQHHPAILAITDSYVDGKRPETRNPYAELAEAKARALPDGWVVVPVEPITGENYENGLWSRRNWTAALKDMIAARPEYPPNGLPSKEPSDVE